LYISGFNNTDNMSVKKLFLLDAYALIFRAYYAFIKRPIMNSKGLNTSAIFGFTNTLDEVLKKEKPTHIAVVFDPPSPTFRHDIFKEYKANRLDTPEEIRQSVPYIKKIIKGFKIPVLEVNGYEADDVIGTVAKKAEKEGFQVYMMTPDKDYTQLVSENILIYKPRRAGGEADIIGVNEIREQWGVENPEQVIDILALWGDSSDNIPGAPGIGEKTAKILIGKYQSLVGLYKNIEQIQGKQKESLINYREQIELARKLVTIVTDVPVHFSYKELELLPPDMSLLAKTFNELEFRTLANRILESSSGQKTPTQGKLFNESSDSDSADIDNGFYNIKNTLHDYHLVDSIELRNDLISNLLKQKEICFDTETTGIEALEAELVGISFSYKVHEAFYVPIPSEKSRAKELVEAFSKVFENDKISKIGQNVKYDIQVLGNYDISVNGSIFDTMIAHYLIQPELQHNMDYLSRVYLKYQPVPIASLIGAKGKDQLSMRDVDVDIVKEYAGEDADITWQLAQILRKELEKYDLTVLAGKIEMPLISVLADMEQSGFKINIDDLNNYSYILNNEIDELEKEIYKLADATFNISSPRQLGQILFDKLKIASNAKKTKTRQYSTSEETLTQLKGKHQVVEKVLEYRALKKLLNTYVEALPKLVSKKTDKIHTSFEQAWVATGRLSSKNPNLQNIPVREEKGREIRKAFIASDDNHILLSADYSQIELRLMAHMSGDENLIEAFINGQDIHTATAAKIFGLSTQDVSREMRRKAKTANFGIIYGISAFGLSQRLNISRTEARELIEGYFKSYGKVKDYMEQSIKLAKENGYVRTIMGRRRYLKDIHSSNAILRGNAERNAINAPIQGSAADIIKLAMVNIHGRMKQKYKTKMILQVHDELIFDVYMPELEEIKKIVRYEMENAVRLSVPLVVDMGTGKNWLDAH
jgi:DNA polymerase-1